MLQDLATLAPSAIVCAVFLVGVVMLVRHEMAPKRREGDDVQTSSAGALDTNAASEANHDI
ncbi:MAG TPA: hypothetical protein VG142_18630 [Trebonia sp.]|nr:hypothetical protein [Trebonia sp.]